MVGSIVNGVPVVDISILERYFDNGNFEVLIGQKRKEIIFYQNSSEAEERLWNYLNDPPQLAIFRDNYETRTHKVGIKFDDKEIYIEEPYIRIDQSATMNFVKKHL